MAQWTPERRKAASEAAKARKAATNKNKNLEQKIEPTMESATEQVSPHFPPTEQQDPMSGPQPELVQSMPEVNYAQLLQHIKELEGKISQLQYQQPAQGLQIGSQGQLVGTRTKHVMTPGYYPNPSERLSNEPRLQRFAFKDNYEVEWEVGISQYQTKDGINTREPRFFVKLWRLLYDEETGLKTNRKYTVCQAIFHEDPDAALIIAEENGIVVPDLAEKDFLDEMRYLRVRDWLIEAFYPQNRKTQPRKTEMVIGNRVVDVVEINDENSQVIPFAQLKNKL